ncbi:874_t:CDS:2, partial [Cetraspora pellucida]
LRNHDPPLTLDSEAFPDIFRVSGVVAVGAHGIKTSSGIMSDQLCSMEIVTGSGEVYEFSEEISKSEFDVAKVNLGFLGIIYSSTFRAQPMYNLRVNNVFAPINEWFNPQTIKNLLDSSDGIEMDYYPFNGFNQSDPNPLDPNKDLVLVKNYVRTGEPVSFTQQQIEKLRETQIQGNINQKKLFKSLLQNPEATPNVTSVIWKSIMGDGNTSFVFQAPDTFHFIAGFEIVKTHLTEIGFKVDPDFSNVAAEFSHVIRTLYEFARKGKFPLNHGFVIRIIKSTKALLSNTFDNDPNTLYCHMDFESVIGTSGWEEFMQLIAQRFFDKYKAKPHWGKEWEFIPNVKSYLSDVLSDQIKQFEKVRAKYDPDKIFFDNKSLQDIFSCALYSSNITVNINEDLMIRSAKPINNKTWENWNGEIYISPSAIFEPSTLEDLIDIVKLAKTNNKTIRCAAQGHAVSSLSVTKNYLVVVTNLKQITIQKHPKYGWTVTAEAGISLSDLDKALRNHDPPLTLDSEAFVDIFRVSGVVAVGAHGSKTSSGIMSDQLCSMKIVTGSGKVYEFSGFYYSNNYNTIYWKFSFSCKFI